MHGGENSFGFLDTTGYTRLQGALSNLGHKVGRGTIANADYPPFPSDRIEDKVISWLEGGYAPEHYSQEHLDELDHLTEQWTEEHYRRHGRT